MSIFSDRLKELRRKSGITQKQLAKAIGASEGGIQSYELQTRKPSYDAIISIAKYFDVSADYMLGITNNPTPKHIIDSINAEEITFDDITAFAFSDGTTELTDEEKEKMLDFAKMMIRARQADK